MEYGIQRRGILLRPPHHNDVDWLFHLFDLEEIWSMFGFSRSGRMDMLRAFRQGDLVTGILFTVTPFKRIGFVIMFPPDSDRDYWEFSYAIPDVADRDAFAAFNSTDAMAHYMFEHLGVDKMGWRVRVDNRAARAVIQRLGYTADEERVIEGKAYVFYTLDRPGWKRRRAKLDRGEETHPSGLGATFVTRADPPFGPVDSSASTVAKKKKAPAKKKNKAVKKKAPAKKKRIARPRG